MSFPKRIKTNYYEKSTDLQLFDKLLVERSGFIPRSVQIAKMQVQGELNKAISDFENNKLMGIDDDLNKKIGLLNIKDMSRSDLIKAVKSRSFELDEFYKDKITSLEKAHANLISKSSDFPPDTSDGSVVNSLK